MTACRFTVDVARQSPAIAATPPVRAGLVL